MSDRVDLELRHGRKLRRLSASAPTTRSFRSSRRPTSPAAITAAIPASCARRSRRRKRARRRRRRASGPPRSHRLRPAQHGRHARGGLRSRRLSGRSAARLRARGEGGDAAREGARRAVQHGGGQAPSSPPPIARAVRDVDRQPRAVRAAGQPPDHGEGEAAGLRDGGRSVRRPQLHDRRLARFAAPAGRAGARRR